VPVANDSAETEQMFWRGNIFTVDENSDLQCLFDGLNSRKLELMRSVCVNECILLALGAGTGKIFAVQRLQRFAVDYGKGELALSAVDLPRKIDDRKMYYTGDGEVLENMPKWFSQPRVYEAAGS